MWVSLCAAKIAYWINLQILCVLNQDFNNIHSVTGECGMLSLIPLRHILGCNLIGRHLCMRSHYISRQTCATVEWRAQTFIHCKFFASSSVSRWKFCWYFWMEQLKGICKQQHCTVNSTRSTDESNQSKQHRYKNLSWGMHALPRLKRSQ